MENLFNSSLGLKINKDQLAKILIGFINADPEKKYKIVIGTDSLKRKNNCADFVAAVAIHRVGNGGRYFWKRFELKNIHTLRDRIIQEVLTSLDVARKLLTDLKDLSSVTFDFEIHVDIGENGPTRSMIQEVIGMIRANNFNVKTKPESYVASKVADRHV